MRTKPRPILSHLIQKYTLRELIKGEERKVHTVFYITGCVSIQHFLYNRVS